MLRKKLILDFTAYVFARRDFASDDATQTDLPLMNKKNAEGK